MDAAEKAENRRHAPIPEEDDESDECTNKYKSYHLVQEAFAELPTLTTILEGDIRLEILGINYVEKTGKQNLGNYNNYFLYWRVLPN